MEIITKRFTPEECGIDRETWRTLQMKLYESQLNDPDQKDLYSDCVEVHVEEFWDQGCTEVLGQRICTPWSIETTFLQWLRLYLNRGIGLEEAWHLAVDALNKTEAARGIACDAPNEWDEELMLEFQQSLAWYKDDEIYRPRIEAWTERLIDLGFAPEPAAGMASELITLLREISFVKRIRPTDFWVMGGEAGTGA